MNKNEDVKYLVKERTQELINLTTKFCDEHLDVEYKQLSEKLILKMSRKRNAPFLYGQIEIWAAAIIHALGRINFLFDKSFKPYTSVDDICNYFKVSKSTVSQKAKLIREMLKMTYWDDEFSTTHMKKNNPLAHFAMVNGYIVDTRTL